MFRLGLVNRLITHANKKGLGLASLSGARHSYIASLVKNKLIQVKNQTDSSQKIFQKSFTKMDGTPSAPEGKKRVIVIAIILAICLSVVGSDGKQFFII